MRESGNGGRVEKEKVIITHYSEEIGDMVDVTLYGRSLALTYARNKKWVSIRVVE